MTIHAQLVAQIPVYVLHRWSVSDSVTPCALGLPGAPYPTSVSPATARKLVLGFSRFSFLALREGGVDTMGPEMIPIIGAGSFFHFWFLASSRLPLRAVELPISVNYFRRIPVTDGSRVGR